MLNCFHIRSCPLVTFMIFLYEQPTGATQVASILMRQKTDKTSVEWKLYFTEKGLLTDGRMYMLALCGLSVIISNHRNRRDNWSHRQFLEMNMGLLNWWYKTTIFNKIQDCWTELRSLVNFHFLIIFAPLWWLY